MTLPPSPRPNFLPNLIFASRWLQLPLYLGLIVAQCVYVFLFGKELWHLVHKANSMGEQEIMLLVLFAGLFAGILSGLILLLAVLPILTMIVMSFSGASNLDFPPSSYSLQWYKAAWHTFVSPDASDVLSLGKAMTTSLMVSCLTMVFATLIAVPAAYALTRCEFRGKAVALQLMSLPLVFPMVVLGLALLLVFDSLPFHMTTSRLVIAHVILALPFVVLVLGIVAIGAWPHLASREVRVLATAQPGERTAPERLGDAVDRGRHLAAGAAHPAVGDERDLVAPILQHAERRGQLVQFGHPVRTRPLEADDDHDIAVEFALGKCLGHRVLRLEYPARRLDGIALRIDRARLEAGTTQVALDQPHSAVGMEWSLHGAEHFRVAAGPDLAPCERLTVEPRLLRIVG